MSNSILKELPELVSNNVITKDIAENIINYYQKKPENNPNKLFTIFGILGALLGGLGIILILAHNWDNFSILTKTIISFIPTILGQAFCFFSLQKKPESSAWRESSSTFLLFAVAATISLIAQVYNLPENFKGFLLTWILLSIPLVYIMRSSFVSLLCIAGITWYCSVSNYEYRQSAQFLHWLLFLILLPYYISLLKTYPKTNFTRFHHWFWAVGLLICLPSISPLNNPVLLIGFISVLSIFYFIGKSDFFSGLDQPRNAFWLVGKIGTLVLTFIFTFKDPWLELQRQKKDYLQIDSLVYLTLFLVGLILLFKTLKKRTILKTNPIHFVFILFSILFFLSSETEAFVLITITNFIVLLIGTYEIKNGAETYSLYKLNFGLIVISFLILCRFFDTEMSFIIRGLLFISIGLGFFLLNYYLLKKRKQHEN